MADGIAIRLYSREDYETRPRFTEPEILRTSLGAVVLHMLSVGVARTAEDVATFGFIDPPDMKAVSDGFNELVELKAIARRQGGVMLTHIGRQLARIPIDVRLGRMVIEAARSTTPNTLAAVLVVVAFLSLQDPRERPEENRDEADRIHNRYADPSSDFLTALNIWDRVFQAHLQNRVFQLAAHAPVEGSGHAADRDVPRVQVQGWRADPDLPPGSEDPPAADQPAGGARVVLLLGCAGHPHLHAGRSALDDGHAGAARSRVRRRRGR